MQRRCFGEVGNDLGLFGTNVTVKLFGCVDLTKSNLSLPPWWKEAARSAPLPEKFCYIWKTTADFKAAHETTSHERLEEKVFQFCRQEEMQEKFSSRPSLQRSEPLVLTLLLASLSTAKCWEKILPQLLIRGWLGLGGFWCNWAGQAMEFLSIPCIKVTHPTI